MEPLPETEGMHAEDWAWTVQAEGRNWANNQQITLEAALLKTLFADGLQRRVAANRPSASPLGAYEVRAGHQGDGVSLRLGTKSLLGSPRRADPIRGHQALCRRPRATSLPSMAGALRVSVGIPILRQPSLPLGDGYAGRGAATPNPPVSTISQPYHARLED